MFVFEMELEIDVSGEDLLNKNYSICVANKDGLIKGFKFDENLVKVLSSRYGQGMYRYKKSKKGKTNLKIRLYCVIIYYLFKSLNIKEEISLVLCRDFMGWEKEIKENLIFFLHNKLGLNLYKIYFDRLHPESNAHKYAYMMRIDTKDKMKDIYVKISLEEIEKWVKK